MDLTITVSRIETTLVQSSAGIARSNIIWYCAHRCGNWSRISIWVRSHKRQSIPCANGRVIGCLLWICWKQLTARYVIPVKYVSSAGDVATQCTKNTTVEQTWVFGDLRRNDTHISYNVCKHPTRNTNEYTVTALVTSCGLHVKPYYLKNYKNGMCLCT